MLVAAKSRTINPCALPKLYPHRKSGDSRTRQLEEKTWMGPQGEILFCGERPPALRIDIGMEETSRFGPMLHWCGLSSSIVTMMQPARSGTRKNKEHEKFTMNPRCSPGRIFGDHPENQIPDLFCNSFSASPSGEPGINANRAQTLIGAIARPSREARRVAGRDFLVVGRDERKTDG
jgi:hypothetical protein